MRPVNVLIADDDDGIRSFLRVALCHEDGVGEVREAANGVDAVALCREWTPDVVLLDYWMPVLDGGGAARQIRLDNPNVRIVAFSGVLQGTPEWADHWFLKGELPDLGEVVRLGRLSLAGLPEPDADGLVV
ncbi:MAG TPA: response regulator transcription factor [Actinomycetota bacterium]|nr:response regulator transcription factor [Actinomycetota bacterium]